MKTITEFTGFQLKNAQKIFQELTSSGKTPEEISAGMGEALKLEGDKLKYFLNALDVVKKRTESLKRVIVLTLAEAEKAPAGAEKRDEQHYVVEFFPGAPQQEKKRGGYGDSPRDGKGGRGGKGRGGRRDGREGGGGGRDGGGGGSRGPRPDNRPPRDASARRPSSGGLPTPLSTPIPVTITTAEPPRGARPPRRERPPREVKPLSGIIPAPRILPPKPTDGNPSETPPTTT